MSFDDWPMNAMSVAGRAAAIAFGRAAVPGLVRIPIYRSTRPIPADDVVITILGCVAIAIFARGRERGRGTHRHAPMTTRATRRRTCPHARDRLAARLQG